MEIQWPLIVFTTFCCIAAGTLAFTSVAGMLKGYEKTQYPGLITAFICAVIGGLASVFHLQQPLNYFNQFGNLSSGINQEIICLVIMCAMIAIYFYLWWRKHTLNKVVQVLSILSAILLIFIMGHSYMMDARPNWNTPLLPFFYICEAAAIGSVIVAIMVSFLKLETAQVKRYALFAIIAILVVTAAGSIYAGYMTTTGDSFTDVLHLDRENDPPVDPASFGERFLTGDLALLFWLGCVGVGFVIPLIAAIVAWRLPKYARIAFIVALVALLAGGICYRVFIYASGGYIMTWRDS